MKRSIFVGVAVSLLLLIAYIGRIGRIDEAPLHSFLWASSPPLVAINQFARNEQTGVLLIRLSDGLEQFFPGEWSVFPSRNGLYMVSSRIDKTNSQRMLYVSPDNVREISLASFSGDVTQITEHSTENLVALTITKEGGTHFCITKDLLTSSPACQTITINKKTQARWHPDNDNNLVLLTEEQKIFLFSRDTGSLKNVSGVDQAEEYTKLKQLFAAIDSTKTHTRIRHIGPLLIVSQGSIRSTLLYLAPMFVKNTLLLDGTHAIVRGSNRMIVVELDSWRFASLLQDASSLHKRPLDVFFPVNSALPQ